MKAYVPMSRAEILRHYETYRESQLIFGNTFLYVIAPKEGPVCVGMTNNVLSRLETLHRNSPVDLLLWFSSQTPIRIARDLEAKAQRILAKRLIKNEWFNVSVSEAIGAVKAANPLGRNVDFGGMLHRQICKSFDPVWELAGIQRPLTRTAPRNL